MKRRDFISNSLWITTGILTGCNKTVTDKSRFSAAAGKVLSQGAGIKDVVVSDGFSVIATKQDGSYEIKLSPEATHIFISTPSGFAFPHKNQIANHYKSLNEAARELPAGDTAQINFNLIPLTTDDTKHKFIIWADPQIRLDAEVDRLFSEAVPDMQQFLQTLGAGELIHGITVGDLVGDRLDFFNHYNKAINQCGIPFFQVLGNHDLNINKGVGENCRVTYKEFYGPTYYSFNRGRVHYVVMDDVHYYGTGNNYKGHINTQQLEWLKKDLAYVPADTLIVLSTHIPVDYGVDNKETLYEILKPYKVHIMTGHMHVNHNIVKENTYEHVHGAVCGAWWTGNVCVDGTPLGYAVYEADGNNLTWQYKSLGKDITHQFNSSVTLVNNQKVLQVNVWNWDKNWTVNWSADSLDKGSMSRVNAIDNLAFSLYQGPELPLGAPWVDPVRTDHLFVATIPAGTTQLKVIATDGFNQKYESVIVL